MKNYLPSKIIEDFKKQKRTEKSEFNKLLEANQVHHIDENLTRFNKMITKLKSQSK